MPDDHLTSHRRAPRDWAAAFAALPLERPDRDAWPDIARTPARRKRTRAGRRAGDRRGARARVPIVPLRRCCAPSNDPSRADHRGRQRHRPSRTTTPRKPRPPIRWNSSTPNPRNSKACSRWRATIASPAAPRPKSRADLDAELARIDAAAAPTRSRPRPPARPVARARGHAALAGRLRRHAPLAGRARRALRRRARARRLTTLRRFRRRAASMPSDTTTRNEVRMKRSAPRTLLGAGHRARARRRPRRRADRRRRRKRRARRPTAGRSRRRGATRRRAAATSNAPPSASPNSQRASSAAMTRPACTSSNAAW